MYCRAGCCFRTCCLLIVLSLLLTRYDTSNAIGDDQESIAWWDNIVDGALYKDLSKDTRMQQGSHLGVLLDLDAKRLELYGLLSCTVEGVGCGSLTIVAFVDCVIFRAITSVC